MSDFEETNDNDGKRIANKVYRNLVIFFVIIVYIFIFIKLMFF